MSSFESDDEVENTSLANDIVSMGDVESLLNTFDEITVEIDTGLTELIEGYSRLNIHGIASTSSEKTNNEGGSSHNEIPVVFENKNSPSPPCDLTDDDN